MTKLTIDQKIALANRLKDAISRIKSNPEQVHSSGSDEHATLRLHEYPSIKRISEFREQLKDMTSDLKKDLERDLEGLFK